MGKRVLILVENLPSPFDRRVWQEACALRDAGYGVSIICPTGRGYEKKFEEIDGIAIWRYRLPTEGSGALGYLVEYSAALGPDLAIRMKYDPKWRWDYTTRTFGCSLRAFEELGTEKGYRLVGCNITGTNAFFVRDDLVDETRFQAPFTTAQHYESPKPVPFRPKRTAADDLCLFFE